jgi:ATP-binding cassette subfamily F protein uup
VFEGNGRVEEYVGGYSDWVRQRQPAAAPAPPEAKRTASVAAPTSRDPKPRRLTFKERGELASLPDLIDAKEREREQLYLSLADPVLLRDGAAVNETRARLALLETEIDALTARWEELETIAAAG